MANQSAGLFGRKIGMTQLFDDDGAVIPVTVIEAGPCTVLQVKSEGGKDGYNAIQLGFDSKKASRVSKAERQHAANAGLETPPRFVGEIRLGEAEASKHEVGSTLSAGDSFASGQRVDVTGVSKGCGFAGVMKRYNFRGFIRSHGVHEFFRHGGSIGTRLTPGHVLKGKKMPGHMGNEQVTVQNLHVARVDAERNLVYVKGGVPGAAGSLVTIRKAVKHG
jgi:large subunit ribosomal protein L3